MLHFKKQRHYEYKPDKPLFMDAANGDYRLAPNSQAINKGNYDATCRAGFSPMSRDLAGHRRFAGAIIDIGAQEYDASLFAGDYVVTTLVDQSFGVPKASARKYYANNDVSVVTA